MNYTAEINQIIKNKNIKGVYSITNLVQKYYESISKLRDELVKIESFTYGKGTRPKISNSTNLPKELTPKYIIDLLYQDLELMSSFCGLAIAQAFYFLPQTPNLKYTYTANIEDYYYWYNIDAGYRYVSSGWDRISLLLNIAFNFKIEKYNLSNVLKALYNINKNMSNDPNFRNIKAFREGRFKELEKKLSEGIRHETTHILSRRTRFFFEFMENFESDKDSMKNINSDALNKRRENELLLLKEHHQLYLNGIYDSLELIKNNFDSKYFQKEILYRLIFIESIARNAGWQM